MLFEDRVEIILRQKDDPQIACKHCHQFADQGQTVGDLPFLLMCPEGKVTLGEWPTAAERLATITAFLLRARNP
jgi:hypothetical protein